MSLTTVDGSLISSGAITLTTQVTGTLPVANGGTGVTTSTGTGANVLGTSPTLTTPTFDSASLATISGTAPLYMCRAWANWTGVTTVTVRASGNVSSITRAATGDYTVNFTTAMTDAKYAATLTCCGGSLTDVTRVFVIAGTTAGGANTKSTTQLRVQSGSSSSASVNDTAELNVAIFR